MSSRKLSESALLRRLGVVNHSVIFEVIVSTCDDGGAPNAAPMGIEFISEEGNSDEHKILMRPFKSTTTCRNLQSQGEAVINVTSDPMLFYQTAFKRWDAHVNLMSLFTSSKKVRPPKIKGCDAYIETSVENIRDVDGENRDRREFLCRVESIKVEKAETKLYCRAPHVLIEAIIHATRVKELSSKGLTKEASELIKLIDRYRRLIHRVAPSSQHEAVGEELAKILSVGREDAPTVKGNLRDSHEED